MRMAPLDIAALEMSRMTIFVQRLRIDAWIGVHHHERGQTQPLLLDLELGIVPPGTDEIARTVDYDGVVETVRAVVRRGHVELVEHLAMLVSDALLEHPQIEDIRVRTEKPAAMPALAACAGAEWFRRRPPNQF